MKKLDRSARSLGAALGLGCMLALSSLAASSEQAVVARLQGVVERGVGEPPSWSSASNGDALAPGDRLRTGRDGRAELLWRGATIRLYGDSMLRLPTHRSQGRGVDLEGGALFDVEHLGDDSFDVRTPDVVVSVKGTRFGVSEGHAPTEVWVYRGTVGVQGSYAGAREVLVREGFRSVGGEHGAAEVFLLDHDDPWQDWGRRPLPRASAAAPASRATHAVVDRVARDRALTLALQRNPALADRLVKVRSELRAALDRDGGSGAGGERVDLLAAVDPLLDVAGSAEELVLRSQFIEQVLNVPDIDVLLSANGTIQIAETVQGVVWALDQNALVDVLEGTSSLPAGLEAALGASQPEDQVEVATVLLGLLGR